MMRWLRRLLWLSALTGAGYYTYRAIARRQSNSVTMSSPIGDQHRAAPAARWVAPADGDCPAGYPIKVNEGSGIYHLPGGRFYARTTADRCYASADDATADGYRQAKA